MTKHRTANEQVSKLDDLKLRLVEAGATADEIADVKNAWNDDDPDNSFDAAERERLLGMSDRQLRAEVLAARGENDFHTLTEEEQAQRDAEEAEAAAAAELHEALKALAYDVANGTVADVIEWVGDDFDRAIAALAVELEAPQPRKGVVEPLAAMTQPPPTE